MAFEGTLKDFHLADIVQLIGLQRKTGVLTLEGPDDTVTIAFEDGALVGARSRRYPLDDRLRRVLPLRGLVTEAEMAEADQAKAETGQRLSHVLTRLNFLSEEALQDVVTVEVHELLYRVFQRAQGTYRFDVQARVDLPEGRIPPLGAEAFLMEGMRRIDEWPTVAGEIPSPQAVVSRGRGAGEGDRGRLQPAEEKVLALVNGQMRVADVVDASELGEFETYKALAALVQSGALRVRKDTAGGAEAPRAELAGRGRTGSSRWWMWALWGLTAAWLGLNLALFQPWEGLLASPPQGDLAKQIRAQADLATLARALDQYYAEVGAFPPDLGELVRRGLVDPALLTDPWGKPYRYAVRDGRYVLFDSASASGPPPPSAAGGQPPTR